MMMMLKTWRSQIRGKQKRTDNYCQCNILPLSTLLFCLFTSFFHHSSSLLLSPSLTFPGHNQNINGFFPNWRKLYTWLGMVKVKEEPNVIRGVQRGNDIITGWNTHRYSWCGMNKILAFFSTGSNNYMTWFSRDNKEWEWTLYEWKKERRRLECRLRSHFDLTLLSYHLFSYLLSLHPFFVFLHHLVFLLSPIFISLFLSLPFSQYLFFIPPVFKAIVSFPSHFFLSSDLFHPVFPLTLSSFLLV